MVYIHFTLPGQISLFQAHGIHGVHAEHAQVKCVACLCQGLVNRNLLLDGVEYFIAELANIVHAVDPALDASHIYFLAGAEWEGRICEVPIAAGLQ